MTIGAGAIGEFAIGEAGSASYAEAGGGGTGATAAQIWAYELLPGISAGEILIALYEEAISVEPGFNSGRLLRIIAAAVAGKTTGGPSGFTARNVSDTANQIVGTADGTTGDRIPTSYGS